MCSGNIALVYPVFAYFKQAEWTLNILGGCGGGWAQKHGLKRSPLLPYKISVWMTLYDTQKDSKHLHVLPSEFKL